MSDIRKIINCKFTIMPNKAMEELTHGGFYLLAVLLNNSEDWVFNRKNIMNRSKCGQQKYDKHRKELIDLGYLSITKGKPKSEGGFDYHWVVDAKGDLLKNSRDTDFQDLGKQNVENQLAYNNIKDNNNNHNKFKKEKNKKEKNISESDLRKEIDIHWKSKTFKDSVPSWSRKSKQLSINAIIKKLNKSEHSHLTVDDIFSSIISFYTSKEVMLSRKQDIKNGHSEGQFTIQIPRFMNSGSFIDYLSSNDDHLESSAAPKISQNMVLIEDHVVKGKSWPRNILGGKPSRDDNGVIKKSASNKMSDNDISYYFELLDNPRKIEEPYI